MTLERTRAVLTVVTAALAAVSLTGCVAKADVQTAGAALTVTSTDTACTVSADTAKSGTLAFEVKNETQKITEFYLLAADGLRIVGEVENVAAGATRKLTVVAQPGEYFTVCKPGMIGDGVGRTAFTVTGDKVQASGDDATQKQQAVQQYESFVKDQVSKLVPAVDALTAAYAAGDDAQARTLFAATRVPYERIEPVAEQLGDLDPRIDYREVDAVADGVPWTGFHRLEKDLWAPAAGAKNSDGSDAARGWTPSTPQQRKQFADGLVADVKELYDYVHSDRFTAALEHQGIAGISNGAIGLLDEVATRKISGEEDWWSHTDLFDFAANVEGSEMAFSLVADFGKSKGAQGERLVQQITDGYANLKAELATHGSLQAGFVPYTQITDAQRRTLTDELNALAEPLSRLTAKILE